MVSRCIVFIASLIFLCGIANGAERAQPRLALVIGNSDYRDVVALPNPAKDATAMDAFLVKAGFDVTPANNLSQSEMRGALRDFADKVAAAGPTTTALVYYAGHGVQIDGENFLIPVDARITRESDVPITAVRLTDVMNILSSVPAKTRIVILDACRNNPFEAIDKKIGRGLAIVDAPRGSIVSYSTAPGTTAMDGVGDHSPFTAALIDVARTPGLMVEQTFKQVRLAVAKATKDEQVPWESSSLISDFAFFPGQGTTYKPREEAKQEAPRQESSGFTVPEWKKKILSLSPEKAYDLVLAANTVDAYEAFLTIYPKFQYVTRIRTLVDRRIEMVAWYEAVTLNDALAYDAFLLHYPASDLAATAQRLMERAKNRSLASNAMASANPNAASAGNASSGNGSTKVITKVVEKPVVVERIVEKVVQVSGPCECRDCGRRTGMKLPKLTEGKMRNPTFHPVQRQPMRMSMGFGHRR
jgi:hypothetical protein